MLKCRVIIKLTIFKYSNLYENKSYFKGKKRDKMPTFSLFFDFLTKTELF
jgi:hypothetical protein